MIYQNSAWRKETGMTLDPLGQPLEPIAKGEKMEDKKITKAQMKAKVLAWIEWLKKEDLKFCKECGLSPEKYLDEYTCFRIEDTEVKGGAKGFTFYFDANLYDIINGYRNDGRHKERGIAFDALTDGTNWSQEAQDYSSEFFYVSF